MSRGKQICVAVAVVLSIASILLAILSTVSPQTTIVLLGVGLLVTSAGVLQKQGRNVEIKG
jgi:low temperature requirement protein LtrA